MKIHITETCTTCDGGQHIIHPDWDLYHAQMASMTEDEFFLDMGVLPGEKRPPQIILCPACGGKGEVPVWVSLQRFMELVR